MCFIFLGCTVVVAFAQTLHILLCRVPYVSCEFYIIILSFTNSRLRYSTRRKARSLFPNHHHPLVDYSMYTTTALTLSDEPLSTAMEHRVLAASPALMDCCSLSFAKMFAT
jgi:hypothetical protein